MDLAVTTAEVLRAKPRLEGLSSLMPDAWAAGAAAVALMWTNCVSPPARPRVARIVGVGVALLAGVTAWRMLRLPA
jgi:hypothetical protein